MTPIRLGDFKAPAGGSAVCVGVFDGVHRGHQALARAVCRAAADHQLSPMALSFDPHPAAFFRGDEDGQLITLPARRAELLAQAGLTAVFASFDAQFAALKPAEFIDVLDKSLGARHVVVGPDFRFGLERAGDVNTLGRLGRGRFEVQVLDEVSEEGLRLRSSSLRGAIRTGDMAQAKRLTGRHFGFAGRVVRGRGLGAGLGFATANIEVDRRQILPAKGVYALRVRVADSWHDAVMNLGHAPTVRGEEGALVPEVHLLDGAAELYGETLELALVAHLRPERRFENVAALVRQIDKDCAQARQVLAP